ncbi:hypothetical protein FA13DRAFT_1785113 [Coprinellus micaceus]|uniref:Uncharacterized protein n=1 Tax=Coprinellus micaceus TaxID=71717 RepID=A0A4Y7TZ23_COPMI|nr:hypothetical protein FA13DRAFT_1785113 [Coprinellus micaceus]
MATATISRQWLAGYGFATSLPTSVEPLALLIPSSHPLQALATRLDALERAIPTGRDGLFQLACCIYKVTGTAVMAGTTSGTSLPRQVDHEAMALLVAAYRVLDAYLHTAKSHSLAPEEAPRSSHPQSRGPHVVDDWVEVAQSFGALMKSGAGLNVEVDGVSNSSPPTGYSAGLLKKMIRSSRSAAIWRIFSNIYSCATYLVSLSDPASIEEPLTTLNAHKFYHQWCEQTSSSDGSLPLTGEERKQLQSISSPASVKGIELCFETAFIGSPILLLQKFDMTSDNQG